VFLRSRTDRKWVVFARICEMRNTMCLFTSYQGRTTFVDNAKRIKSAHAFKMFLFQQWRLCHNSVNSEAVNTSGKVTIHLSAYFLLGSSMLLNCFQSHKFCFLFKHETSLKILSVYFVFYKTAYSANSYLRYVNNPTKYFLSTAGSTTR